MPKKGREEGGSGGREWECGRIRETREAVLGHCEAVHQNDLNASLTLMSLSEKRIVKQSNRTGVGGAG